MTDTGRRLVLLGRTYRRRLVGCVVLGLVVGVAAWFFGVDLGHAVGLGAVAVAASACVTLIGDQPRVDWAPDSATPRDGARRDIVQLGWALHTRGGGVAPEAVRRLRTLAAHVLELHGLDLDDPSQRATVEGVLGADAMRILRRGTAESPKLAAYRSALMKLERVAESPPGPLAPTGPPAPTGTLTPTGTPVDTRKENTDAR